jgi:hypothetical protein
MILCPSVVAAGKGFRFTGLRDLDRDDDLEEYEDRLPDDLEYDE